MYIHDGPELALGEGAQPPAWQSDLLAKDDLPWAPVQGCPEHIRVTSHLRQKATDPRAQSRKIVQLVRRDDVKSLKLKDACYQVLAFF